jgi:hypothetical protein
MYPRVIDLKPEPDKALVAVIEEPGSAATLHRGTRSITDATSAVVKVGADGAWIGANRGNSIWVSLCLRENPICV